MVAMPVIRVLGEAKDVHLTIASDNSEQALTMISQIKDHESKLRYQPFQYPKDMNIIEKLIKDSDVIISLMPATMHIPFAELAIKYKRHLVTASYVSDAMQQLNTKAKENGVILLNEVGLDPGIDHMLIQKAVDIIHSKGGSVTELISLCGGLPDPSSADNPFRYKFSWSPKGVLLAACNGAVHLEHGKILTIPPGNLLQTAEPSKRFPTMRLEALPNRDSIKYRDVYGVKEVETICRGTLRYEGWSNVMFSLQKLGLFEQNLYTIQYNNWLEVIKLKLNIHGGDDIKTIKQELNNFLTLQNIRDVDSAMNAIEWLGLLNTNTKVDGNTPLDALCNLLQSKLKFKEGEKDMVAMFHSVLGKLPDGTYERHISRLLAFGNPTGDSAMAATVGYTTAAAVELLLQGKITETGVIIPTHPEVYKPMLERLQQLGITYSEAIENFDKIEQIK